MERDIPWRESQREDAFTDTTRTRSGDAPHATSYEDDGGEGILSGRSRERHSEVPEDVDDPETP